MEFDVLVSASDELIAEMNTNRVPFHPEPRAGIAYNGNQVTISGNSGEVNQSTFVWAVMPVQPFAAFYVPGKAKIVLEIEVQNGEYSPAMQKLGGDDMRAPDLTIKNGNRSTFVWYSNDWGNFAISELRLNGSRNLSNNCVIKILSLKAYKATERVMGEMDVTKAPVDPQSPPADTVYENGGITIHEPATQTGPYFWDAGQIQVRDGVQTRIELDATSTDGQLSDIALFKPGFIPLADPTINVQGNSIKATWLVDPADESYLVSTLRVNFVRSGPGDATLKINSLRVWQPIVYDPVIPNALDADEILKTPPVHDVDLKMHNGAMTMFLDGNPITGQSWTTILPSNTSDQYLQELVGTIDHPILGLPFAIGQNALNNMFKTTWLADDVYDWSSLDTQAKRYLNARLDAKIILFLAFDGAAWWTEGNPDAVNRDVDLEEEQVNSVIPGPLGIPDYLNPKWKVASREVLRQLIAHVQTSDWGEAVIGYELFNGFSMDANFMIPHDNDRVVADLRAHLTQKYGTDAALQAAWKDLAVTLNNALPVSAIPSNDAVPKGIILKPSENQRFLDTRELLLSQWREVFSDFASVIKEATHGRALVGARTGDFMGSYGWNNRMYRIAEDSGWLMPLLKDPNFDYFDVQEPYVGRQLGDGANAPVIPIKAVNQYGKAVFLENDVRTYLSAPTEGFGRTPDLQTTIQKQRQIFSNALTNGSIPGLFQLSFGYNHPDLINELKRHEAIMKEALQKDRSSTAEVAFVMDPDMRIYLGNDGRYTDPTRYFTLFDTAKHMWQRAGVPFDMIFLDQIPEIDPYKVYVFVSNWKYTEEQQDLIRGHVLKDGQTVVFLWADGVLSETGTYDAQAIAGLTGMNIQLAETERSWTMQATQELANLTGVQLGQEVGVLPPQYMDPDPGIRNGVDFEYGPSFSIGTTSGLVPLATKGGAVTAGLKEFADYQVIYSASGNLTLPLYELAIQKSNVFRYTDSMSLFMMNKSYVGFHADKTETITLRFPTAEKLTDLFSGQVYPANTEHSIPVERGHTYLFAR